MARWYRGDCHLHSVRSTGGELTPAQLTAAARAAGLDFVAVTEHNTTDGYADWIESAGGDLLVIPGQEVVTRTGHWLALGLPPGHVVDWRYGVDDDLIGRQLDEVHRAGGLCVVAHPYAPYPSGTFDYPYQGFDAVEVWNGQWASDLPWNADNESALTDWSASLAVGLHKGAWRPTVGNSDTHLAGQIGVPHTVVRADEFTVDALLAGIAAGHSWVAGSGGRRPVADRFGGRPSGRDRRPARHRRGHGHRPGRGPWRAVGHGRHPHRPGYGVPRAAVC
jgi:hypothetical protein